MTTPEPGTILPLSIATFNAENFYLLLDNRKEWTRESLEALDRISYLDMNTSIYNYNKDRTKIALIAAIILERDFDIICLCEVGGMETLSAFNRLYLDGRYDCHLQEENSRRGIYVGLLTKRGRFPRSRSRSVPADFSRNLLRFDAGAAAGGLEIFALHLKSQMGDDFGIGQRLREVEFLARTVRLRNCIVLGDFNGILIRGSSQFEFEPFLALPFTDVLEAVGIPPEERYTHYHFGSGSHFSQLDYIFCTSDIIVLDAGVIEGEIPQNRAERDRLPSDHLFVHATILPAFTPRRACTSAGLQQVEQDPETWEAMKLSRSGFDEWDNAADAIYDHV